MLTNYLKIAFRTLLKNKTYAFINIAGLAAGLMCCILLTLYVKDELIFDRHHERGDRIYRVLRETRLSDGEVRISPKASGALATALESEMPEIERAIGIATPGCWVEYENEGRRLSTWMAPPEVLDVFSFPLLQGDARTALKRPASVLLTEKTTRFFFGGTNPVGKIITINNDISGLRWRELTSIRH